MISLIYSQFPRECHGPTGRRAQRTADALEVGAAQIKAYISTSMDLGSNIDNPSAAPSGKALVCLLLFPVQMREWRWCPFLAKPSAGGEGGGGGAFEVLVVFCSLKVEKGRLWECVDDDYVDYDDGITSIHSNCNDSNDDNIEMRL